MLPSPAVSRSRQCLPRNPRITTVAAVILVVACLYHTQRFKNGRAASVERASLSKSAANVHEEVGGLVAEREIGDEELSGERVEGQVKEVENDVGGESLQDEVEKEVVEHDAKDNGEAIEGDGVGRTEEVATDREEIEESEKKENVDVSEKEDVNVEGDGENVEEVEKDAEKEEVVPETEVKEVEKEQVESETSMKDAEKEEVESEKSMKDVEKEEADSETTMKDVEKDQVDAEASEKDGEKEDVPSEDLVKDVEKEVEVDGEKETVKETEKTVEDQEKPEEEKIVPSEVGGDYALPH